MSDTEENAEESAEMIRQRRLSAELRAYGSCEAFIQAMSPVVGLLVILATPYAQVRKAMWLKPWGPHRQSTEEVIAEKRLDKLAEHQPMREATHCLHWIQGSPWACLGPWEEAMVGRGKGLALYLVWDEIMADASITDEVKRQIELIRHFNQVRGDLDSLHCARRRIALLGHDPESDDPCAPSPAL